MSLGRFRVGQELGRGAMGAVYLGQDIATGNIIAIKTMALAQEFDDAQLVEVKERFFREAEAAGRLQHPHIVTIYESGELQNLAYIAMEYLPGHDLTRYCHTDSLLAISDVIFIITMAASALDYAHCNQVIHRDIKPANLMFDPEQEQGLIKLTDFGIARIADSGITRSGKVLGTPSYMSPEQLYGRQVDGRSDLFSLGVMLYEMVTGKLPFTGSSLADLMVNIANKPHLSVIEANPALAGQALCLIRIIDKALQKKVEDRYQTGAEMVQVLRECAATIAGQHKR
ncbi:MAG: Protein kinase protein [Gammaproteobacteria bacterium]|nr:Protein kinase protein [Gammaproteobacteria bacterium]